MLASCRLLTKQFCLTRIAVRVYVVKGYHQRVRIPFEKRLLLRISPAILLGCRQKPTSARELRVWRVMWNNMFSKYLLVTNTLSSGLLMVIGDLMTQEMKLLDKKPTGDQRYDYHRFWRMFVAGMLMGPLHHYVYRWMDRAMPAQSLRNIGRKILIDQLFMSPACLLIFFYSTCYMEKKTFSEATEEVVAKFPFIYMIDWAFWPGAQYINFRYLDPKYRVAYVNVLTAIYDVLVSYVKYEFHV